MTSDVLSALLTSAKLTLRLHTNAFDSEISDLIEACEADLLHRNAIQSDQMTTVPVDPLIKRAIMTYVRAFFGTPDDPERLKADYDEQKATLMMTTGFTDWEETDGQI